MTDEDFIRIHNEACDDAWEFACEIVRETWTLWATGAVIIFGGVALIWSMV